MRAKPASVLTVEQIDAKLDIQKSLYFSDI